MMCSRPGQTQERGSMGVSIFRGPAIRSTVPGRRKVVLRWQLTTAVWAPGLGLSWASSRKACQRVQRGRNLA